MAELTQGELRFIDGSTSMWRQKAKNAIMSETGQITDKQLMKLFEMEKVYKDAFRAFYQKAKEKGDKRFSDAIQYDFDREYKKENPEYYEQVK